MTRGMVGRIPQGMTGQKALVSGVARTLVSGTTIIPRAGWYRFALHGPGGVGTNDVGGYGGGSGAYVELTKRLNIGNVLTIVRPKVGAAATITFPDGTVASAGHGGSGSLGSAGAAGVGTITKANGVVLTSASGLPRDWIIMDGVAGGIPAGGLAVGSADFPGGNASIATPGNGAPASSSGEAVYTRQGEAQVVMVWLY